MLAETVMSVLICLMMALMLATVVMYDYAWWESRRGELPGFTPDSWTWWKLNATAALTLLAGAWALWMAATGRLG